MSERVTVRVGIVSWNVSDLLGQCLDSIPDALEGYEFQVVVVDNASHDDSVERCRRFPYVRVISNPTNLGYAKAMNRALTAPFESSSNHPKVWIALNPDTSCPRGSLAQLVDGLLSDHRLGLVAPRLVGADGEQQHSVHRFPSPMDGLLLGMVPSFLLRRGIGRSRWYEGYADYLRRVDIDWAIGAVHVMDAELFTDAGPYDERWFMYVEDLDLCWRLHKQGRGIRLLGDVTIVHIGNASGVQAWGTDTLRRWLGPTYDWMNLRRGRAVTFAYLATNLAGLAATGARWTALSVLPGHKHFRAHARDYLLRIPLHIRVMNEFHLFRRARRGNDPSAGSAGK